MEFQIRLSYNMGQSSFLLEEPAVAIQTQLLILVMAHQNRLVDLPQEEQLARNRPLLQQNLSLR